MIVGIGIDVVHLPRVRRLLDDRAERAIQRLFTAAEAEYARGKADPARHLAARIAAKEAAFKALAGSDSARGIGWRDTEVVIDPGDGRPTLRFHGRAVTRLQELGVTRCLVSMTHDGETAAAVVILERE